jgi:hypothetical protein
MKRLFALIVAILLPAVIAAGDESVLYRAALEDAGRRGDALWRQIETHEPRPISGCRQLFAYALTLCEARSHPERLPRVLSLLQQMQDPDPQSKTWGNLRWCWRDADVTDTNAVEFSMQDALIIDIRHSGWLPTEAKHQLDGLLRLGLEGCLRHRVPTDYTNMAILNAGNLIVLGERLHRADAAGEGYRRLDGICLRTAVLGIHEFCSPTYYGTDLNGLLLIRCYAQGTRQRNQAEALLKLFWTDIAANWFPAAQRLAGCHSRSYDYLRGLGGLDWHLWMHGWVELPSPGRAERCEPWSDQWLPPSQLAEIAKQPLPRLVRQHWGLLPAESRTQILHRDVALSCCGAGYSRQDSTLAVDPAGGRDLPRCYFIADGRNDPYGKITLETGAARHPKALHLQPFWAGAQRSDDALGLVIYRAKDLAEEGANVRSHFVFRRPDALWLDGRALNLPAGTAAKPVGIPVTDRLVIRYGSAAVGVSFPWNVVCGRGAIPANLVDDGNPWNCLRLTLDHGRRRNLANAPADGIAAGAAIWVRVGSCLERPADLTAWRKQFEMVSPQIVEASDKQVRIELPAKDGLLSIAVNAPWDSAGRVRIEPQPFQGVLEVDGREVGRPLLTAVEPLCSLASDAGPLHITDVLGGKSVHWEAETGLVLPGMTIGQDATASGGRYVGQNASPIGQPSGTVLWTLSIERPDRYWLWARVRSVDPDRGAFSLQVARPDGAALPAANWLLRSPAGWQWQPLRLAGSDARTGLDLIAGVCRIQLQTRQSGTRIDRLMLTPDPNERP